MQKEWKIIEQYPDYSISNYGEVKNNITGRILVTAPRNIGTNLCVNCRTISIRLWNLVAAAFLPAPVDGGRHAIIHIDGDITNNRADNLKWDILDGEIWRPIPIYPDYSVSNYGRLKHDTTGETIICHSDGKFSFFNRRVFASKVVATVFIANPNHYSRLRNIDGDITNNRVDNLEWYSPFQETLQREKAEREARRLQREAKKLEHEKLKAEKREAKKLEHEKLKAEKREAKRAEQEKLKAEKKLEREKIKAEKRAEQEKIKAEKRAERELLKKKNEAEAEARYRAELERVRNEVKKIKIKPTPKTVYHRKKYKKKTITDVATYEDYECLMYGQTF